MSAETPSSSRFRFTERQRLFNRDTYSLWVPPRFLESADFEQFTVPSRFSGRADLISNVFYDTPDLYWVLIAFNKPADPLNWPKPNQVIRIPNIDQVLLEI